MERVGGNDWMAHVNLEIIAVEKWRMMSLSDNAASFLDSANGN
jgi:hypothetical protein